jgi:hypothetical protein
MPEQVHQPITTMIGHHKMKSRTFTSSGTAFQRTVFALVFAPTLVWAQELPKLTAEGQKVCATLDEAIDSNIRQYALAEADGELLDKSAIQQVASLAHMSNQMAALRINLHLQERNKCAPRTTAIDPERWKAPARKCQMAISTRITKQEDTVDKDCNVKNWGNTATK